MDIKRTRNQPRGCSVAQHLPNICETLGLVSSAAKKKYKKQTIKKENYKALW